MSKDNSKPEADEKASDKSETKDEPKVSANGKFTPTNSGTKRVDR